MSIVKAQIFMILALLAQGAFAQEPPRVTTDKIVFPHLTLNICENHGRSFEITVKGDTATVRAEPYEDFGGVTLCFERDRVKFLDAWAEYDFGALQYLFDDKPAKPIDITISFPPAALDVDSGMIVIPQTYENFEGVESIGERIGYSNRDEFEKAFESNHLGKIKAKSLQVQREFYTNQLNKNRKVLSECCPEYIEQAEAFLRKPVSHFAGFEQLAVEVYRKKSVIKIEGTTIDGVEFEYTIIDDN